mmetsp:Transcript_7815/g.22190  ORF Transcript_7815/g.22190 Transcript_7815/m.22190 type:complete len:257 (-) Transcript_7815:2576-3346(-)
MSAWSSGSGRERSRVGVSFRDWLRGTDEVCFLSSSRLSVRATALPPCPEVPARCSDMDDRRCVSRRNFISFESIRRRMSPELDVLSGLLRCGVGGGAVLGEVGVSMTLAGSCLRFSPPAPPPLLPLPPFFPLPPLPNIRAIVDSGAQRLSFSLPPPSGLVATTASSRAWAPSRPFCFSDDWEAMRLFSWGVAAAVLALGGPSWSSGGSPSCGWWIWCNSRAKSSKTPWSWWCRGWTNLSTKALHRPTQFRNPLRKS